MSEKENVLTKTYQLLVYLIPLVEKFPRSQKFVLGDRIEAKALDILELLVAAYYGKREGKLALLEKTNLQLENLRFLIRLSHDFQFLSHQKYGAVSERVNEIGKMIGGWSKSLLPKESFG
jgi:hypothetical protein